MQELTQAITENPGVLIIAIIFGAGVIIAPSVMIFWMIKSICTSRHHENTVQEIAAYIAEGSMTPEDGEKLLASSKQNNGSCGCG